jgi:hypothetical protein
MFGDLLPDHDCTWTECVPTTVTACAYPLINESTNDLCSSLSDPISAQSKMAKQRTTR